VAERRVQRRLAAIVAADLVGYSRLVGDDEEGTIARLTALREELIYPSVAHDHGRVVKSMGDGFLIEFPSVVNALRNAVELQREVAERNADQPEDRRMEFRVGINLGDIVMDGDDILGDGVNVAARIEALADPGGICLSGAAYGQVEGRLGLAFDDLGEHTVKNIKKPIRVYRVRPDGAAAAARATPPRGGLGMAPLDKPSIAVLPFDNMSDDPEQEYFVDGMVEDIITALSRFDSLFVIARNSSFVYKGRAVDVRQAAQELGVRYVLEGSVRKAGNQVRVTGQLIEGATGTHLWADRFDGRLEDIFELQDNITVGVVGAIEPALRKAEIERSRRKPPENLLAYDYYMRALPHAYAFTPDDNIQAADLLDRAIGLDPRFAEALACAAWCREQRVVRGWPTAQPDDVETGVALARAAIATESENANAIAMAGFVLGMLGREYDPALRAVKRALDLNPNAGMVSMLAGMANVFFGDLGVALDCLERSRRLSPSDPQAHFHLFGISCIYLLSGRYEDALAFATKALGVNAEWDSGYWILAAALAYLGRAAEAKEAVSKLLTLAPGVTLSRLRAQLPIRDQERLEILLEGMRTAGLPE